MNPIHKSIFFKKKISEGKHLLKVKLELVFVKHYAPNCLTLTLLTCLKLCYASKNMSNGRTDGRMDAPEAICPSNFFEGGGLTKAEM